MSNISEWLVSAGSNNASPPNGWPEGMQRSAVNDTAREMMAALARQYQDTNGTLLSTGTSSAYAITTNSGHTALNDISVIAFRVHVENVSDATLNVDGLGAKPIHRRPGSAVNDGNLPLNGIAVVQYNPNQDRFELLSGVQISEGEVGEDELDDDAVTTDKIDDDAVTLEKMQNIPTDTILGRDTAGTGDIETLTLNEPLFFDAPGTIGVSSANTDDAGIVEFATAAEVAAEDFDLVFSPGRAVGLPGVGKAWASILNSGSASIESSYNVDSVNRTGTGVVVVTLTNTMANDDYVVQVTMGENAPAALRFARITDRTTTAFTVNTRGDSAQADVDFFVLVHGALA